MSTKISFNIPDYSYIILNTVKKTVEETGYKIAEEAKKNAPVNTGYYRNQIMFDGVNKVVANAEYSAAIEYGVKARIITPKTAKALHFKINGKDVFAKIVRQSARKPNPVMRLAAINVQKKVNAIFKNNLGK